MSNKSTEKPLEYKHLKEGDIITCEAGGYADFQVGGRYEVKKDCHGLYLTCSGFERPYYLHEMFKHLDTKLDVVYCMCRGGFIFYKEVNK